MSAEQVPASLTAMREYAEAEEELSLHKADARCDSRDCPLIRNRDRAYQAYTHRPHVSLR